MKTTIIGTIILLLFWNCKQKQDIVKPVLEEKVQAVPLQRVLDPALKDLALFAAIAVTDTTDLDDYIDFKAINDEGELVAIDADRAVVLYRKSMSSVSATSWPIAEVKNTDNCILMVQGKGLGGPIWAKILVDRSNLAIVKIQLGHKAETEGYGDAIVRSSFGNGFKGAIIKFGTSTYGLRQGGQAILDGTQMVDGLSGATVTSKAAVEMLNNGLKKYEKYLGQ